MPEPKTRYILKIGSFEGHDTHLHCGDDAGGQDFLYCVIVANPDGTAVVVDSGYRTEAEARAAWPEIQGAGSRAR